MSLLFIDGFDHYASADMLKKWSLGGGYIGITSNNGRRGGGSIAPTIADNTCYLTKTLGNQTTFVVGFAFYPTSYYAGGGRILSLVDGTTEQVGLYLYSNGTLSVLRNGTALTGGTSTATVAINAWNYLEIKGTISTSIAANSCKVRLNGADIITVAAGQSIQATANAFYSGVRIGPATANSAVYGRYDDFYICNQSGTVNNDFLGDCRIDTLLPTSDGTYTDGTPSVAGAHYLMVDENPPNTTDYVDMGVVGNRDSYGYPDLTALTNSTVYGVQLNAAALKDDSGTRALATFARSGTTNSDGASYTLSTSQLYASQVFETAPGGAAWTQTLVNGAEFGTTVTL